MKLATFVHQDVEQVGLVDVADGTVTPVGLRDVDHSPTMLDLVRAGAAQTDLEPAGSVLALDRVQLRAPIPRPIRNVFCVGKNYHDHAREFSRSGFDSSAAGGEIPEYPIFFSKVPESVVGPADCIRLDPRVSEAVDYEVELALVMGPGGRNIPAQGAFEHIWGYTIINDVTARDIQGRHKQWLLGKSQDTFCPMGPWIVTADELDATALDVSTHVNGELRQTANTRDLIFDIPTMVAAASNGITLLAGDIIATGTPAGVGIGFDPPRFLQAGDVVRMDIEGIGTIENRVESMGEPR